MTPKLRVLTIAIIITTFLCGFSYGTTYYVDPNGLDTNNGLSWANAFLTIQKGIDTSSSGDTILVDEGTYYESIDFSGKSITVQSTDPNDWDVVEATIIDANDLYDHVVTFDSGEDADSVLSGFTVTGGNANGGASIDYKGAGILCNGDGSAVSPIIRDCIIRDNAAQYGAGIYNYNSSASLDRCIFRGNSTTASGGAMQNTNSSVEITNCMFFDNDAKWGGAMHNDNSDTTITNCTFTENEAKYYSGGGKGGVMRNYNDSDPVITNCILWNNSAEIDDDEISNSSGSDVPVVTYSDVEGGYIGTGNINTDPNFVDADNDDFHLTSDSSCVDAGDPNGTYTGQLDIDGDERVQGTQIDMGADENRILFYVDSSVDSSGDGSSWQKAYKYLDEAINTVSGYGSGSELWVAAGLYMPDCNSLNPNGTGGTGTTFNIPVGVEIYGGFDTFETSFEQRDPRLNQTVLSGDIGVKWDNSDNSHNVVIVNANSVIDGFYIEDGVIGIACPNDVTATIQNCVIQDNEDGVVIDPNAVVTIQNNVIRNNAYNGIYSIMGQPTITNNAIYDNTNGIAYLGYTEELITNNTIVGNICSGILSEGCQDPNITNCILWDNGDDLNSCSASYSCIKDGDAGTGNISTYPHFTDIENGDFSLMTYSACIDAGDSSDYSNEPDYPTGKLNIGMYGNTVNAQSKSADTDSDGLPDDWEMAYLGTLSQGSGDDTSDSDGLTNLEEYQNGTDTGDSDTDGDGMPDGWEVDNGLDPLDATDASDDPDGDDKTNYQEYLAGSNPASSDIITVPGDYSTIQAAINACDHDWDIVEIDPNTYTGTGNTNLDFGGKVITVRGNGSGEVIIDCNNIARAFWFHSSEEPNSIVSDITIINGSAFYGGAVLCQNSSPIFDRCLFKENVSVYGGAVYNEQGTPEFLSCVFMDNEAVYGNGGVIYNASESTLSANDPNLAGPAIPIALWKLDDGSGTTASDSAGGNDGTITGAVWKNGVHDGALDFDGTDDYVTVSNDTSINFGSSADFSIAGWFKTDSSGTQKYILSKAAYNWTINNGTTQYVISKETNNKLHFLIGDGTDTVIVSSDSTINDGSFHHFCVSIDRDGNAIMYIDGAAQTDVESMSSIGNIDNTYDLLVGRNNDVTAATWDGLLDDVRIYDGALSSSEVQALYGSSPYYPIGHWTLDDGSGTTATDMAGDNNGTLTNMEAADWISGVRGGALDFDGSNEYVDCGTDSSLEGMSALTLSAWIYPTDFSEQYQVILEKTDGIGYATSDYGLMLLGGTDKAIRFQMSDGSGWPIFAETDVNSIPEINRWYHIVGLWDGDSYEIYIDGQLEDSNSASATSVNSSGKSLSIGRYGSYDDHYFEGKIDDVRVYDEVLPLEEIQNIGGFYPNAAGEDSIDSAVLTNCTLKNNTASIYGGGLYNDPNAAPILQNCIIWGNSDSYGYDGLSQVFGGNPDVQYSCIQDTDSLDAFIPFEGWENHNIDDNPHFVSWVSQDLIAYWSVNEGDGDTAYDSAGNNNGDLVGDSDWTTGKVGGAIKFDGSGDYIEVGDDSEWSFGSNDFSVVMWVNFDSLPSSAIGLVGQSNGEGNEDKWNIIHNYGPGNGYGANKLSFNMEGSTSENITADWSPSIDTWYHLAFTRESNQWTFYIDGSSIHSEPFTGSVPNPTSTLKIGAQGELANYLDGSLDEVRVYKRALYADEVEKLYQLGLNNLEEDLSLSYNSPCIDTGSNSFVQDDMDYDLYGAARIFDGDNDGDAVVDMGACEFEKYDWSNQAPVLDSIGDKTVAEGVKLRFTLNAVDAEGDTIWYSVNSLPTGAVLDGNIFLWTPEEGQEGTYSVTLIASDGQSQDSETIEIEVVEYQLAAYWNFDDGSGTTLDDATGNHDGTLVNMEESDWTSGAVDGALNFGGDTEYVTLQNMDGAYYSISFWANFGTAQNGERIVDFGGTGYEFYIARYGTGTQMTYQNGSALEHSDSDYIVNGEWHYYTVVHVIDGSDNDVIFYRDGVQYGNKQECEEDDIPSSAIGTYCYIGTNSSASGNYFEGYLDELRIYERSLEEDEVERLYENQNAPVLTEIGNKSVEVDNLLTFTLSASDTDDDDLTYSAENLPTGARFNGRTFSWIPTSSQTGNHNVTFTAQDDLFSDTETITISVSASSGTPQGTAKAVSGELGNDLNLSVDPFTGSVSYSMPIIVPPARQGTEPSLVLQYSGAGNGWCGFGWSLGMGTIQRNTRDGLPVKRNATTGQYEEEYDNDKGFTVSFASVNSRLTWISTSGDIEEYRAEIDQAFLKYEFDTSENEWIVTDKSGNIFYFGEVDGEPNEVTGQPEGTVGVRMDHPDFDSATDGEETFLWALAKIIDMNGNTTYLDYVEDDGQIYLDSIRYNGNLGDPNESIDPISATHTVEFVLEDRPDTSVSYSTGYRIETNKRLSEILVKIYGEEEQFVRRYKLNYRISPSSHRSLLHDVVMFGSDNVSSLPPVTFEYQECEFEFGPVQDWGPIDNQGYEADDSDGKKWNSPSATDDQDTLIELLDINSDGLPDRVMRSRYAPYDTFHVQLNTGTGFEVDGGDYVTRSWGPYDTQGHDGDTTTDTDWASIQGIGTDYDARTMLFDINGDGFADRVMVNDVTDYSVADANVLKVQLNNGLGFDSQLIDWPNVDGQGDTTDKGWNGIMGGGGENDTFTMMSDINGDGLPDRIMRERLVTQAGDTSKYDVFQVQLNTGSGFEDIIDWGPVTDQSNAEDYWWSCPNARENGDGVVSLLDINGDGFPDRVMREKTTDKAGDTSKFDMFLVQFNTGYGFEEDASGDAVVREWGPLYNKDNTDELGSLQGIEDATGDAKVMLFDISADGLPDRILRNSVSNFSSPENVFKVQLNTGTGFEPQARLWKGIDNQDDETETNWNSPYGTDSDGTLAMLFDINGDGLPDRVMRKKSSGGYAYGSNVFKVQLNRGPVPDMLKRVKNAMGGQVQVAYTPSTRFDNTDNDGISTLPFPMQVASSITLNDGLGTETTTTYDYSRGYFDVDRREFRGFGRVEVTGPYGAKSVSYFHQGGGYDDDAGGEYNDENAIAKKGMPYRVESYGSDGKLYTRTINKIMQDQVETGKDWYFAYTAQTVTMEYEGLDTYRAKAQSAVYDPNYGRIETSTSYGEVENVDIENHTFTDVTSYSDGRTDYAYITTTEFYDFNDIDVFNKVQRTWVSTDEVYANRLAETVYTYDPNTAATLTESKWVSGTTYLTKSYEYDDYGNQDKITNEVNISTTVTYDDEFQMFAIEKSTGATSPFVTETTTDARSGLPLVSKNAMGIKSEQIYDVFFRLTDSYIGTEPNETPQDGLWLTHLDYNVGGIEDGQTSYNYIRQRHNGFESYIYNDGLGRPVQTRIKAETGAEGEYRVSDAAYDKRGKVYFTCDAFFDDGIGFSAWDSTRPGVLTEFDATGRPYRVLSTHDDGEDSPMGAATTAYSDNGDPWTQKAIDPQGKVVKKSFDARGRVITLTEVTDDGDIDTNYYYDLEGRLTDSNDLQGNNIHAEYDAIGRKIRTEDPDSGVWTYEYDDDGKLSEQTDARGNTVMLYYNDALRRLTKKEIYNNADPQVLVREVTYTYDSGETGYTVHKGQLFKVAEYDGSENLITWTKTGYDSRGRAVKSSRYIEATGDTYTTQTTYDDADRITTTTYPNNDATLAYDYGTAGELTAVRSTAGTGANETFYQPQGFDADGRAIGVDYGNGISTEYDYYTYSKRLRRIHSYHNTTGNELFDLYYTFDEAANITNVYDEVYTGSASAAMTNIQYDDLYRLTSMYSVGQGKTVTFEYDDLGNILKNGDNGTASYVYNSAGHTVDGYTYDQPHAVTSANGKSYAYDEAGNMTTRGTQTLTYDEQNNLVRVYDPNNSLDVSYVYTADGTRLYKVNNNLGANGTITQVWIGGIYEEKYDSGRDRTLTLCHVSAGGQLVATFEPESTWAGIVQNNRYLAKTFDIGGWLGNTFFGNYRTTLTVPSLCAILGLAFGLYYNRRRLWVAFRIYGSTRRDWWMLRNPAREVVLMLLMGSIFICSMPPQAYADSPTTDPVFYYYQSDHLGSASVMTTRDGDVVQHYGYTAFGHERYKHNTAAFDVTNRYTGQQIDEETGLYFYQSRYYDAELGRFTQADTIVPSSDTSQALNRYAYVKNNPLKFTDPSGHGWFSKILKKLKPFIGVVVTVAFGFVGYVAYSLLTGASWKSIAIGLAISFAAGYIANGMGGAIGGGTAKGFEAWAGKGIFNGLVAGALTGAVSGAISSAVYGGNWGKNIGQGASGGTIGAAVGMATRKALDKLGTWVKGMSATGQVAASASDTKTVSGDPNTVSGPLNLRTVRGKKIAVALYDGNDPGSGIDTATGANFREAANDYYYSKSVGSPEEAASVLEAISRLGDLDVTDVYFFDHGGKQWIGNDVIKAGSGAWARMTAAAPHATFHLRGCQVATGHDGLLYIEALANSGNVTVTAFDENVSYWRAERWGADYYSYGNLWTATPNEQAKITLTGGYKHNKWWRVGRR